MKRMKLFTEEYDYLVKTLSGTEEDNRHATFRERDIESLYNGIAIEIVQEDLCQLSCEWCYINQSERTQLNKPLSINNFDIILEKIKNYDNGHRIKAFSNIIFIGGEPTINPNLEQMIKRSLENGLNPIIVTNGLKFADLDYAEKICVNEVNITIHLPLVGEGGDNVLDKATKCPGYSTKLHTAIENLINLKKRGVNIDLVGELVVCDITKDYAYNSYVYCRELGVEPFFELMRISNDAYTNKHLLLKEKDIQEIADRVYQYDLDNGFILENLLKKTRYFLPPAINSPCTLIQNSIHIKFEKSGFGKVISCCGQSIGHGNIMDNTLESILENKENTKIFSNQKTYIKGPCSLCELYDLTGCEGGCRGNAKNTFDCAEASDPQCIFITPEVRTNTNIMTAERSVLLKENI